VSSRDRSPSSAGERERGRERGRKRERERGGINETSFWV